MAYVFSTGQYQWAWGPRSSRDGGDFVVPECDYPRLVKAYLEQRAAGRRARRRYGRFRKGEKK